MSGLRLARSIAAVLCFGAVLTGVPATPALASKVDGFDYAQNWICSGSDSWTATSNSRSRAKATARATSAAPEQRAISAGR